MARNYEVLAMLIPNGGYTQIGEDYEGIEFLECEPITRKQYEEGFAKYDVLQAQQNTDRAAAKSALLTKLGLTEDEANLLLS